MNSPSIHFALCLEYLRRAKSELVQITGDDEETQAAVAEVGAHLDGADDTLSIIVNLEGDDDADKDDWQ